MLIVNDTEITGEKHPTLSLNFGYFTGVKRPVVADVGYAFVPFVAFGAFKAIGHDYFFPAHAQHSISTRAPSARPAAPKAERVGMQSGSK